MSEYVIVVESNDNGVESVHGAYSVDGVLRAQQAIRRDLRAERRSDEVAVIVELTAPDEALPSHRAEAFDVMLDGILHRYDGLVTDERTVLASMLKVAERTQDYDAADERREFLWEQKAEIADALVYLLRKGFVGSYRDEVNDARVDAWRERKLHDIGREIAEEFRSEES